MNPRLEQLLRRVVDAYTRTAEPVGSAYLAQRISQRRSPATIRNELAELEGLGLLHQPHTSAGRVPTEAGYRYYVLHLLSPANLSRRECELLRVTDHDRDGLKSLARNLAELSQGGVLVAFSPYDLYYTGLSNLFAQPEFTDFEYARGMSQVIDHLDTTLERIFPDLTSTIQVRVGADNPFSDQCSALLSRYGDRATEGVLGILGPLRMDYARNVALLEHAKQSLQTAGEVSSST